MLGLRAARSAWELERNRHERTVDRELIWSTRRAALALRDLVRRNRVGEPVAELAVRAVVSDASVPLTPALADARELERDSSGRAMDAYMGIILDTNSALEESAARRAVARLLARSNSPRAALAMLRVAQALTDLPQDERDRLTQATQQYATGAPDVPLRPKSLREAEGRLLAAPDPDQLILFGEGEVAWLGPNSVSSTSLDDLMRAVVPGYRQVRWQRSTSGEGRALPRPFPRLWLAATPETLAAGHAAARRLRHAHTLLAILGGFILGAAAVAAWIVLGRQQRFEQRRTGFLCAVTHELKTPIANISLYAELIRDHGHEDPERVGSFAGIVLEETARLRERVEEMLAVASGREELPAADSSFDPVLVVADVVAQFESRVEDSAMRIDIPEPGERARGAEPLFRRAVEGVLSNAVHYAAGTLIAVQLSRDESKWTLLIDDAGPGIPASERENVFQPFFRLDTAVRSSGGTGLGLALVRQCVQDCGGAVTAEESDAGGTRIRLTLERVR